MAMNEDAIAKAGTLLAGAWSQSALLEGLPSYLFPGDIHEAAEIQDAMAAMIGSRQKIGITITTTRMMMMK